LIYKEFIYNKHDWDNIPSIVPKYVIYLSKYIRGISGFCKEVSELETTAEIKDVILKN
jgi:hypothetical protein